MKKCFNLIKGLTEREEYILTSNYMDFLFKYNKKLQGMSSDMIVKLYLETKGKGEEIDNMLENINNVIDLLEFANKYNGKILMIKAGIRKGYIKEIYIKLENYKHLIAVYRIKDYLEINGFNQDNLPEQWLERIMARIDNAIEEEKRNKLYRS